MGQGVELSKRELDMKRFHRTTYYQTIVYQRIQDTIIDKECRLSKACDDLNEPWKVVKQFLSTEQKENLKGLVKLYGRNQRVRRNALIVTGT